MLIFLGDPVRIILLITALVLSPITGAAESFDSVCPDFENYREQDMQIQPDEFDEEAVLNIIHLLNTEPETGMKETVFGHPVRSWAVILKGYVLRMEWLRALAENRSNFIIESRRKAFCEFLLEDGYYVD